MKFNKWDGIIPETAQDKQRAKHAGLGTLSPKVCGKSCQSCEYYGDAKADISYCYHEEVLQTVAGHQGCRYWESKQFWLPVK